MVTHVDAEVRSPFSGSQGCRIVYEMDQGQTQLDLTTVMMITSKTSTTGFVTGLVGNYNY